MLSLGKLLNNERGATAIDYALTASLISMVAIASFDNLGGTREERYLAVEESLDSSLRFPAHTVAAIARSRASARRAR